MQAKTTRAFRTISEAGEELDLQPHVLRFWESKFPQIKPIKRGGGRRFYRPEDIEFIRGIKILLHDEKHPIKDVQKLIRVKGADRVIELGQSEARAARERDIKDTVLVPERIKTQAPAPRPARAKAPRILPFKSKTPVPEVAPIPAPLQVVEPIAEPVPQPAVPAPVAAKPAVDKGALEDALSQLTALRARWKDFEE